APVSGHRTRRWPEWIRLLERTEVPVDAEAHGPELAAVDVEPVAFEAQADIAGYRDLRAGTHRESIRAAAARPAVGIEILIEVVDAALAVHLDVLGTERQLAADLSGHAVKVDVDVAAGTGRVGIL